MSIRSIWRCHRWTQSGQATAAYRLGQSRRAEVRLRALFCPQIIKTKSTRKHCWYCGNSFYFWTNGTASNRGEGGGQHNVMETADFAGKPFPCPVCNMELRLKISRKQKPYCMLGSDSRETLSHKSRNGLSWSHAAERPAVGVDRVFLCRNEAQTRWAGTALGFEPGVHAKEFCGC